jgi:hypothetical protein
LIGPPPRDELLRIGPQRRLIMGGRGSFAEPRSFGDHSGLAGAIRRIFPETTDAPIEYCWVGRIALTYDSLPHVHRPAPGICMALGYNGRGVAMASALGTAIGTHLLDRSKPAPAPGRRDRTDPPASLAPADHHGLDPLLPAARCARPGEHPRPFPRGARPIFVVIPAKPGLSRRPGEARDPL